MWVSQQQGLRQVFPDNVFFFLGIFVVMMKRVSWSDGVGGSSVIGEQYNEPWVSNTAQYNVHVGE